MPSSRYYRFKAVNKKDKIKKIKIFIFSIFASAVFLFLIWLVLLSPVFHLRYFNVSDENYLKSNDIEKILNNIMPFGLGKNLLILPKNRLKKELTVAFPSITEITIKKKLFHTLAINFQKRIQLGIWCRFVNNSQAATGQKLNADDCYFFDKEGIAFAKAPQTDGSLILKIEDGSKNNIFLGNPVLDSGQINFLISVKNKINENNKLKILEFKIKPNSLIDLEATTDKNWSIYLDDKQDPILTINNLLTILKEAVKNSDNLEYIDLRTPSRIFYKLK